MVALTRADIAFTALKRTHYVFSYVEVAQYFVRHLVVRDYRMSARKKYRTGYWAILMKTDFELYVSDFELYVIYGIVS